MDGDHKLLLKPSRDLNPGKSIHYVITLQADIMIVKTYNVHNPFKKRSINVM